MALCTETAPLSTRTADTNLSSSLPSSPGDALPQGFSILSGRGGLTNRHPANRVYRRLIQHNKPIYQALQNKQRQVCLIQSIVKSIQASNGRFLRKEGENWIQLSDKEAYEKVKQAIREPDSKYAATCSIKSDHTMTSSCLGDGSSSASTASTSSTCSQQPSQDSRAPVDDDVNYCVNKMDEEDDLDNVSCFSDFTVDGPVAPLSRGVSAFLDDQAGSTLDASAPFAKIDFRGVRNQHALSLPPKTRSTNSPYGTHVILGRKPRKHSSSLLEDTEDSIEQQLPPATIVCPTPTVLMRSMSSDAPWKRQQQPSSPPNLGMFAAPQPIDLPQICPCKVHQMNTSILAWNLQLQAYLEAQLQGHSPSPL